MIFYNEPMKNHTTFRVGGAAKVFIQPESIEELIGTVEKCVENNENYIVIGNGSNVIFADEGYDGTVIDVSAYLKSYEINIAGDEAYVTAQAGVLLTRLGNDLAMKGITGFEFATGIPGCIGGAVSMNAGAYGGEIKDCLRHVKVYMPRQKRIEIIPASELSLGYRTSRIQNEEMIVLEAQVLLKLGEPSLIKEKIKELSNKRKEKQPLEFLSAGSTFKRSAGGFAAKLIEDAGLKGYSVGGMMVSEKHAGFVINTGNGTANDFLKLTDYIKKVVKDRFGVELELEVKIIN